MDNKKWLEYDSKNCIELIFKIYMSLIKFLENLTVPTYTTKVLLQVCNYLKNKFPFSAYYVPT